MAVGLNSSLSALLLNPYASTTLQAAQQARAPIDPIRPGATITARYTVEEDGALSLRDVNVVDEAGDALSDQAAKQRQQTLAEQNRQQATLADLTRPKATLAPADEVILFAASTQDAPRLLQAGTGQQNDLGAGITEITFDDEPAERDVSLEAQQKTKVASLYARNADITYNVDPVYSQAA